MAADVRVVVNDDESLEQGILPALRDYNLSQFITVDVPGASHQVCFRLVWSYIFLKFKSSW